MSGSSELSRRSNRVTLAAWGGSTPFYVDLLEADACDGRTYGAWRVVELYAQSGPFEVSLEWTAGMGGGQSVLVTVARNTRVSLFAKTLRIRAANLDTTEQFVGVMIADGYGQAENFFEQRGTGADAGTDLYTVPSFSRRALLEVADPAQLASFAVAVKDGAATLRGKWPGNGQPGGGMPMGAAKTIEITRPGGVAYRLVHSLNL